jgi:hypothetical protein
MILNIACVCDEIIDMKASMQGGRMITKPVALMPAGHRWYYCVCNMYVWLVLPSHGISTQGITASVSIVAGLQPCQALAAAVSQ